MRNKQEGLHVSKQTVPKHHVTNVYFYKNIFVFFEPQKGGLFV